MTPVIGSRKAQEDFEFLHGKPVDSRRELMAFIRFMGQEADDERASLRICTRATDAVGGRTLSERFVSWLEVKNAISRLPFDQRIAVELHVQEGLTQPDVAERMRRSTRYVQQAIADALDWLVSTIYD